MNRKSVCLGIFCFLFAATRVSSVAVIDNKSNFTLYFGVFISQESEFDFSGFIPPLELGIETINKHSTVLKGLDEKDYFIEYEETNAKVRSA